MNIREAWEPGWQLWQALPEAALHIFCRGSEKDGPTALITAGVHGDEYEGPAAVATLAAKLSSLELSGRVLLAPVVNPLARVTGTRNTLEDGRNLARCFPGDPAGSITQRLAHAVFTRLAASSDMLIDLHSGGVEYRFLPMAGFYGDVDRDNASYSAARAFGLAALWQLPPTSGVLSYEMTRRNKVAIGHEYLGAGQLSEDGLAAYVRGTMRCLEHWGILSGGREDFCDSTLYIGDWTLSAAQGLFRSFVSLGEEVKNGTVMAEIADERGRILEALRAPFDGTVLGLRSKAHITEGAWAVLLGRGHAIV